MTKLTARFDDAFTFAHRIHGDQTRKGNASPYIGHLMGVASIVLDDGGSEDEAIGGLLHDAAEDHGGRERVAEIAARFGPAVAKIVTASDPFSGYVNSINGYSLSGIDSVGAIGSQSVRREPTPGVLSATRSPPPAAIGVRDSARGRTAANGATRRAARSACRRALTRWAASPP